MGLFWIVVCSSECFGFFFSFQQISIACIVFAKVKASCYIIIKIIVFLNLEDKSHYFSVVRSSVDLPEASCLADIVRFQLEQSCISRGNQVNWQCTIKSLFKLSVQGVGWGRNLSSGVIPSGSETAQIPVSVSDLFADAQYYFLVIQI